MACDTALSRNFLESTV